MCWTVDVCFQIRPQEMSEGCFWVLADEDQYAKPELLSRVALTFCSQRTGQSLSLCFFYICIYLMFLYLTAKLFCDYFVVINRQMFWLIKTWCSFPPETLKTFFFFLVHFSLKNFCKTCKKKKKPPLLGSNALMETQWYIFFFVSASVTSVSLSQLSASWLWHFRLNFQCCVREENGTFQLS